MYRKNKMIYLSINKQYWQKRKNKQTNKQKKKTNPKMIHRHDWKHLGEEFNVLA